MVIAVYGGSFNPPHVGHGMVAAWLLWTRRADRVWLLPAFQHAFDKSLAPFEARCGMCAQLAREVGTGVEVCAVEAELPTPSYTYNTLRALRERHPTDRFRLVIGADNLAQIDLWYRWDGIQAEFSPIVVGRQGFPPVPDAPQFPGISSTEVRRRVAGGEPFAHLVPAAIRDQVHALYGGAP
ncbi:MAG: nicotinate (nicotinamide) nucleotide adenylyltransferase [Alphaproteobacteria bacterium]|nr:nicotinate (nicotinamide) nucleotide adenylyltransferase [Alphaproteobacteria bacterium]